MGNIADALKKAGVELVDDKYEVEQTFDHDESPAVETASEPGGNEALRDADNTSINNRPAPLTAAGPVESFERWDERIDMVANHSSHISEAFRILRSKILHPQDGSKSPRTIMIASSAPEEGKSFISVNLAIAIARGLDQYSLLVDCDLRRPSLSRLLGMEEVVTRGLTEYLRGECEVSELIHHTAVDKLSLLGSGSSPVNPAELLSSERMELLVNELSRRYADRIVIFDSPPFQVASESIVLAQNVDGVVLVIGSGKSDRNKIKAMVETIGKEKVLGAVFNGYKEGYVKHKMFDPYGGYGKYYKS